MELARQPATHFVSKRLSRPFTKIKKLATEMAETDPQLRIARPCLDIHQWCPRATWGASRLCGCNWWFVDKTKCPGKQETNKPRDYKSRHYKGYGLNAQVVCDQKLCNISMSIMCPGKTNDVNAYRHLKTSDFIEALPAGYFVVGDNAYVNSDHLLVPYPGENIPDDEDAFNFFLSQLRIRVENTFAHLVAKWGVSWRPLNAPLRNQSHLVLCLCQLHNFCIDEKEPRVGTGNLTTEGLEVPLHAHIGNNGQLLLGSDWATTFQFQPSVDESDLRDQLKNHVCNENLRQPT
jgi:hypothetical protein